MNYWDILQIAPTSDKAAIKKAYAALLKKNKPDENPKGFAELHRAYKYCLETLNEQQPPRAPVEKPTKIKKSIALPIPKESDYTITPIEYYESPTEEKEQINNEASRIEYLKAAWPLLEEQVNTTLSKMSNTSNVNDWKFLNNHDALYDIDFKAEFSLFLFSRLLDYFEKTQAKVQNHQFMLSHLNAIFRWSDHYQQLQTIYGYDRTDQLLHQLAQQKTPSQVTNLQWLSPKNHRGPIEYGNYYSRIAATLIDSLTLFAIGSIFSKNESWLAIGYAIVLYTLLTPLLEASPLQGSPGKVLFGIKVTSPKGKRLNIFHALWRQVLFVISIIGFKVTVWINLFTNDGRLLHDRMSSSIVIKR